MFIDFCIIPTCVELTVFVLALGVLLMSYRMIVFFSTVNCTYISTFALFRRVLFISLKVKKGLQIAQILFGKDQKDAKKYYEFSLVLFVHSPQPLELVSAAGQLVTE